MNHDGVCQLPVQKVYSFTNSPHPLKFSSKSIKNSQTINGEQTFKVLIISRGPNVSFENCAQDIPLKVHYKT